ncbi:uncharacterized protein LOC112025085 [Quercus suber]|uniref:uncharacterized protein LOC112025085 n=1 Tax=Quercus suber TaxID=58331 RepID=UPI000CE165D5|nr:uncharacterized protein LOC112025085 [Quercus suber]
MKFGVPCSKTAQLGLWEHKYGSIYLWKLNIPNKVKIFGWRACRNILPTLANLAQKRIIQDSTCEFCKSNSKTGIHALWDCEVAQDIWAGCSIRLQKCYVGQADMIQLMEEFNDSTPYRRAGAFSSSSVLCISSNILDPTIWCSPLVSRFKLNFVAAIFAEQAATGVGVIIHNGKGEVMAFLSAKGPPVMSSEEAEIMACGQAIEFAIDCGFLELVVEASTFSLMNLVKGDFQTWEEGAQ